MNLLNSTIIVFVSSENRLQLLGFQISQCIYVGFHLESSFDSVSKLARIIDTGFSLFPPQSIVEEYKLKNKL